MKKIIAFLTACAFTVSSGAALAAEPSRSAEIMQRLQKNPETISVFYNGMPLEYNDVPPENIDGRVMIPFRAVLEGIGAQVEYSEAENKVTAKKNDTSISFALDGNTIYIDKNGEKSELKMDVPIVVKEGRTLVPIRFMSKAFGMNVGWDGMSQSVLILDKDGLAEEFREIAPNMNKLMSMENPTYNIQDMTMKVDIDKSAVMADSADAGVGFAKTDTFDLYMTVNAVLGSENIGMNIAADYSYNKDGFVTDIKDLHVDAAVADGKLYFKTDAAGKLADVIKNSRSGSSSGAVMQNITDDTWYCIDFNRLPDGVPMYGDKLSEYILGNTNQKNSFDEILDDIIPDGEDVTFMEMIFAASMLDTYSGMDKYVVITEKENGGYTVSIKLDENDFKDMMSSMYEHDDDEITNAIMTMMMPSLNINSISDVSPDKAEASASIDVSDNASGIYIKMELSGTSQIDETAQAPKIPENAVDITDMIIG